MINLWTRQRGDTIVEVLMAMTVTAAILGSSYTVVNRSLANSRQAQEHGEALQIANKQAEYIASLAAAPNSGALFNNIPPYKCADQSTGALVPQPALSAAGLTSNANLQNSGYSNGCITNTPVPYYVAFTYLTDPSNAANKYFKIYVTWSGVTGQGNDQITLVYKPYNP